LSGVFGAVIELLGKAWGFINGNEFLLIMVAAPFVIGVLGALLGIVKRGGN